MTIADKDTAIVSKIKSPETAKAFADNQAKWNDKLKSYADHQAKWDDDLEDQEEAKGWRRKSCTPRSEPIDTISPKRCSR